MICRCKLIIHICLSKKNNARIKMKIMVFFLKIFNYNPLKCYKLENIIEMWRNIKFFRTSVDASVSKHTSCKSRYLHCIARYLIYFLLNLIEVEHKAEQGSHRIPNGICRGANSGPWKDLRWKQHPGLYRPIHSGSTCRSQG